MLNSINSLIKVNIYDKNSALILASRDTNINCALLETSPNVYLWAWIPFDWALYKSLSSKAVNRTIIIVIVFGEFGWYSIGSSKHKVLPSLVRRMHIKSCSAWITIKAISFCLENLKFSFDAGITFFKVI